MYNQPGGLYVGATAGILRLVESLFGKGGFTEQIKSLASKYNVRSVPTVVIEEGGVEVDRFVGVIPKQQVLNKIL